MNEFINLTLKGLFALGVIASFIHLIDEFYFLKKMNTWTDIKKEHPKVSSENNNKEVLIVIHDKGSKKPRVVQARVHYKEKYTYGYLGQQTGFGLYFGIPSIVPASRVSHWKYLDNIPKGLENMNKCKHPET